MKIIYSSNISLKNIFSFISILLLLTFASFGCRKYPNLNNENASVLSQQDIISLWDYKYSNENYGENVIEITTSPNKKYTIGSYIPTIGHHPEIFSIGTDKIFKRLTNSQFIKFSPAINDIGDIAYALSEYSTSISKLYLNGKLVPGTDNLLFYDNLALNNNLLVYSSIRFYDNTSFLNIYNITTNSTKQINTAFYLQKISFLSDSVLIFQGYNTENLSNDIFEYNLNTDLLKPKYNTPEDELLFEVQFNKTYKVVVPTTNKPLFNSVYTLFNRSKNQIFSKAGNDFGRTSWYVSYLMEAYIKLYKSTGDDQWKHIINENIDYMLKTKNEDAGTTNNFNPSFLWSAKKYSIDNNTPISLLVDNAKILYPMLCAYNEGIYSNTEIINITEKTFNYFESYYNKNNHLYSFQKGINFWFDGVAIPFNQQNAWGLCLIELYKATKKPEYKARVKELAEKFKA